MVNVLSGYRFLFITTAIVSFLPIVSVNANPNNLGTSCNVSGSFFTYSDSKKHTISNKNYTPSVSSLDDFIAVFSIEKEGTVLNLLETNIISHRPKQSFLYSASVKDDGKLVLTNSNIKDMSGFRVQNGQVVMNRGKIEGSLQAVCAEGKKTDIALVSVNIDIVSDNLNAKGIGFVSSSDAFVRMSGSTITFHEIGAFSTQFGGKYLIDTTNIQGKGKKHTIVVDNETIDEFPRAFDISQGGDVHLRGDSIQLTDMHGFLITNFAGYADAEGKLVQEYASSNEFKKTSIKIEKNNISVQGEGVYGLYFYGLGPDVWGDMFKVGSEKLSKVEKIVWGEASLHLSQTAFSVPDGIAIYSTGDDIYGAEATIELTERTKISGDLLLKAQNNSSLLVKAKDSTLTGGIRVEDASTVHLELTNGSAWYLTKRKHTDLQESLPVDSLLSSISISDSTIFFDKFISQDYQTLYIGKVYIEKGSNLNDINPIEGIQYDKEAYNAKGNVQIKMSAFVNNDGSFNPQKTDRILIYGNVLGSTLLMMEKFSKTLEGEAGNKGSQSISLVQVAGTAEESSFKLANSYTTVNGFPYQYKLRVYGPSSSSGNADPKNRLVVGEGDFWDFRLESVYIGPELDSSETASKPTSTVLPPQSEEETVPSKRPTETISPEQPPSVEPPLIPSTPSLPEGSEPSETFIPTDSTLTPSAPVPSPSVPTVPENPSAVPMPAPFVPVETSTDEVMPSKPSVPEDTSSLDTVSPPSVPVEPKPSQSSEPLDPSSNLSIPLDVQSNLQIRAVVPQVPTYLLLPNALFHAGLVDMITQNKTLETMRNAFHSSWKENEKTAFFLRAYGGSHHYASNLSAFEYGYGAELDYNALEAGVLLNEIESLYGRTFFGVLGNYGNLSLHPQDVEQSKKSAFNKWSVA
ncbi:MULTISPECIES: autotransporter outer membrane beta-barrel domain-containing protein, partial [unclassified Bartonella]|uniref:autotransporter outer membrane beta-barrel domain-containing protein n=1 Tax=unclassified Bartonella TaxID=2645622 RepID=UPI0035CE9BB5